MTTTPAEYPEACLWPVDAACFEDSWDALDPDVQLRALTLASQTLNRLTGFRVGGCPITVRPCKPGCASGARSYYDMVGQPGSGVFPYNWGGVWVNSCGCTLPDCSCGPLCSVRLPGPVGRVDEILIDGAPLTEYVVHGTEIVYTGDGDCPFPSCQDMSLPTTEEGTFSITYLNSYPVDGSGAFAAGTLAMEFAKACTGKKCRLPDNVTVVTRQGVTMEITAGTFPDGRTGIRSIDAFIGLWNPQGLRQDSTVWYPGQRRPRVTG